jgi:aryl-alcohol dehydrogenase-like predicted oxidoreductase
LADAWLGKPEPAEPFENRSLTKYKLIIDELGGWPLFQHLLETLRGIADSHETDIAAVASAAVLARPGVAAVIVGARNRAHLEANLAISRIALTPDEQGRIDAVLAAAKELPGEVYGLERDRHSRHGAIMKYNLNEATG